MNLRLRLLNEAARNGGGKTRARDLLTYSSICQQTRLIVQQQMIHN